MPATCLSANLQATDTVDNFQHLPELLKFLDSKQRSGNHLPRPKNNNNVDPIILAASSKTPAPAPYVCCIQSFRGAPIFLGFLLQAPNTNTKTTTTDAVAGATFTSNTHT